MIYPAWATVIIPKAQPKDTLVTSTTDGRERTYCNANLSCNCISLLHTPWTNMPPRHVIFSAASKGSALPLLKELSDNQWRFFLVVQVKPIEQNMLHVRRKQGCIIINPSRVLARPDSDWLALLVGLSMLDSNCYHSSSGNVSLGLFVSCSFVDNTAWVEWAEAAYNVDIMDVLMRRRCMFKYGAEAFHFMLALWMG